MTRIVFITITITATTTTHLTLVTLIIIIIIIPLPCRRQLHICSLVHRVAGSFNSSLSFPLYYVRFVTVRGAASGGGRYNGMHTITM